MLRCYFITCFVVFSQTASTQNLSVSNFDPTHLFNPKELKQDFTELIDSLRTYHPALYRFTSKEAFKQRIKHIEKEIRKPLTLTDFYLLVSPIAALIGDIHTSIELPDDYHQHLTTKSKLLPLDVRIIDSEIFIASNNSENRSFNEGAKILEINRHPPTIILRKMESCFSSDATNQSFKERRVEQRFAFHYQTVFGPDDTYFIKFQQKGKAAQTIQIPALPFSVIKENREKRKQVYPLLQSLFIQPPFLSLSIDSINTAVLTIKTFEDDLLKETGQSFKPFVDSAFNEVKKAQIDNLIIDVRGNEGGTSAYASYLYSYLSSTPFSFIRYMEASRKIYLEDKKNGVSYSYNSDSGAYRTRDSSAANKYPKFYGLNVQQPRGNHFSGKIYVIINGLTTSSASQFVSVVKQNERGVLIGEEAPGPLCGGSGREYLIFKLPNTGLVTVISKYRVGLAEVKGQKKDISIAPDLKITYKIEERLENVDKELEWAHNMVNKK